MLSRAGTINYTVAMAPTANRAQQFADLEDRPVKGMPLPQGDTEVRDGLLTRLVTDYDPEADIPVDEDDEQSSSGADEAAGTEHYVSVG